MGFPRQEYWSGLPFPTPGGLPDSGIEHVFLASPALAGGFFTTAPPGKPYIYIFFSIFFSIMVYNGGISLVAQMVKHLPTIQETRVQSLGQEDPWRREWPPTPVFLPGEFPGQRGPGSRFQSSCLGNPMDRGAWRATVHGVTTSRTCLSNTHDGNTNKLHPCDLSIFRSPSCFPF